MCLKRHHVFFIGCAKPAPLRHIRGRLVSSLEKPILHRDCMFCRVHSQQAQCKEIWIKKQGVHILDENAEFATVKDTMQLDCVAVKTGSQETVCARTRKL